MILKEQTHILRSSSNFHNDRTHKLSKIARIFPRFSYSQVKLIQKYRHLLFVTRVTMKSSWEKSLACADKQRTRKKKQKCWPLEFNV